MSEQVLAILLSLSGLLLGGIIGIIVFYLNRHFGKKKNLFDERYQHINSRAKAKSWDITLVILLIAWGLVIIYEGISFSFFLLTAIYSLHCFSLVFTTLYYKKNA